MTKNNKISEMVSGLLPETISPFWHKGEWAVHELLPILIDMCGVSNVYIASFSVSEDSLRVLFSLNEERKMNELSLLLDNTVKRHKLDLLFFANNITPNISINANHAKMLLVTGNKMSICVLGSANLNLNKRYECGFISNRDADIKYLLTEYKLAFDDGFKPERII